MNRRDGGRTLSRRDFGAALLLAGGIAGCSATSKGADRAAGEDRGEAAGFPVSVRHKFGTTVVPAPPERVVSAGYTEHDTLLALGVIPVGVTDWYGDQPYATWPWARAKLGPARPTVLRAADGFDFEQIARLDPDLIVGTNSGMKEGDYAKLSRIAPTIAQSGRFTDYFEPWDVQSTLIGRAVGKRREVAEVIGSVKQSFSSAKKAHPEFAGKKAVFLQNAIYDGSAIAYQKGLSTDFLTRLGFDIPGELDSYVKAGQQAYIPVERLSVLDSADVLVWATEKDSDRTALEKVVGFDTLSAVRADRSLYTGGILSAAIYFTSPLSLPYVLQKLTPMLAGSMRGSEGA